MFLIVGGHVLGMYALVLVIGTLIDRIGRMPALVGADLMAVSCIGLLWFERPDDRRPPVRAREPAGTFPSCRRRRSWPMRPGLRSAARCSG